MQVFKNMAMISATTIGVIKEIASLSFDFFCFSSLFFAVLFFLLFLFLFFTASVKAQKEAKDFNVDSTLYAYYQRCQECLLQPVVLSMSDTLYRMAEERHDKRMLPVPFPAGWY